MLFVSPKDIYAQASIYDAVNITVSWLVSRIYLGKLTVAWDCHVIKPQYFGQEY